MLATEGSSSIQFSEPPSQNRSQKKCRAFYRQATTPTNTSVTVTLRNTAAAPVFYAVVTSTYAGRFNRNLLMLPPRASRTIHFLFAANSGGGNRDEAPTIDANKFESSMSVGWLNKA
jgi:hypothetical protein